MAHEEPHADLAGAILDGTPIDWAAAESGVDPSDRSLLDGLKVLAAVADLHRSAAPSPAASAADRLQLGNATRWGHLTVLERVGAGAFGEVYRAWDARLDREVALKLLPAAATEDCARGTAIIAEGRALARVRHPGVVTLYGAEVIDGLVGLWMELIHGRTLEELVAEGRRWGAREAAALGADLCGAVAAVHAAGLVHRDIKAANVMLQDDGRVVLMDFGTGRVLADGEPIPLGGTPLYLAPELFAGDAPSVASDVYSVGVLLHHLLTGSYPVLAKDARGLRLAHERGERKPLGAARPDLPSKLARAIDRATDVDPARRHPSAEALAGELAAIARPRLTARVRAIAAVAGLLVLLALAWEIQARLTGRTSPSRKVVAGFGDLLGDAARGERAAQTPTIVVLPFDNLSEERESDAFVDGLTDEILRDLARVDGLAVRSRYSSFTFRGPARDLRAIGERLRANLAVTGAVLRTGNQLRVTAQLVDVVNDRPLWTDRFDRTIESSGDLLALVDEIAGRIVNQLRLTLGAGRRRYDVDLDAYEKYLKARELVGRRGALDPKQALGLLDQIVAKDPTFAPAHAAISDAYGFLSMTPYQTGMRAPETLERMRQAAARAIELDPLLAEGHAAMGVVHARDLDWARAQESFERALKLDRTLTPVYTGYSLWVLRPLGRFEEAERILLEALANDPLSLDLEREIAETNFGAGHYQEAIERLERVLAADPAFPLTGKYLGRALVLAGRTQEGLALLEAESAAGHPSGDFQTYALIRLGRRAEAERLADENKGFALRETVIYTALGDYDRAFEALDRAGANEPQRVPILLTYPELAPLRGDARMVAVRQRFRLP